MQRVLERLGSLNWGQGDKAGSRRRPNNLASSKDKRSCSTSSPLSTQFPAAGSSSVAAGASTQSPDVVLVPPSLFQPGQESGILSEADAVQIDAFLPGICQGYCWKLLYSLQKHGASYSTFYQRTKGKTPTILVVRTVENEVFGGVTTTPWAVHMTAAGPDYYGTGESFLYALGQEQEDTQGKVRREGSGGGGAARVALGGIEVFPWSRENNLNMLSTETSIGMGGGNGEYGLLLGENFESGVSGPSETYGNPQLSRHKHFDVLNVECWSLEQPTIFLAREQQQLAERRATNMRRRSNSLDPHHHDCSALYRSFSDDDQGDDGRASPAASRRDVERSRSMGAAALRSVESM